ncbi:hypothetical protein [Luteolibacter sp. Populi]|uniref:hypothetical protein n=1 Tax=Luteolibacter sp. Populi TaxID=3230487 RepID=UPI003467261E
MKRQTLKGTAFLLACLATAGLWHAFWPAPPAAVASPEAATPAPVKTTPDARALVAELAATQDKQQRMSIAARLLEIPVSEIPALLDSITVIEGHQLSLAAKTLLIRWASVDGRAAVAWAWPHLREKGFFPQAMAQIGPAWAWQNPRELAKWAGEQSITEGAQDPFGTISLEDTLASDSPLLNSEQFSRIAASIARDEPRLAFGLLIKARAYGNDDITASLQSVEQIREALLAFDNLEGLDYESQNFISGPERTAKALFRRWCELDRSSFEASAYSKLVTIPNHEKSMSKWAKWREAPAEDRLAGATALLATADEAARHETVGGLARDWAAKDPAGCRAWLETLPGELPAAGARYFMTAVAASDLAGAVDFSEDMPPAVRQNCLADAHRLWRAAHPEETVDTSGWSEPSVEAWEDLDALWQTTRR